MTPEGKKVVTDAMTTLSKVPNYSGAVVVLFTSQHREAGVFLNAVGDDLANGALEGALQSLVTQRSIARSPIIVPADYRNREARRKNGG